MKFLADGMLGKLTRWLRIIGQDVTYTVHLSDNELLDLAKKEQRILLTKDFELYKRAISRNLGTVYFQINNVPTQLAEVSDKYNLEVTIDMDKSHCPVCNTILKAKPKEQISVKLKENTYAHYDKFWECPNCGQIYWQGSHWKQITNTLNQARKQLDKLKENSGA